MTPSREREFVELIAQLRRENDLLRSALLPFQHVAESLVAKFEVRHDDTRFLQLGGRWLTWGDFRGLVTLPLLARGTRPASRPSGPVEILDNKTKT